MCCTSSHVVLSDYYLLVILIANALTPHYNLREIVSFASTPCINPVIYSSTVHTPSSYNYIPTLSFSIKPAPYFVKTVECDEDLICCSKI